MRPACKWAALCLRSSANLRDQVQRACTGHQDHRTGLRSADGCIQSLLCENAHTHTHFRRCALDWIYRHRTEKHTFWGNGSGKKGLGAFGRDHKLFQVPNRILPKTIRTWRAAQCPRKTRDENVRKLKLKLHRNKSQVASWLAKLADKLPHCHWNCWPTRFFAPPSSL